jgi:hypothetical protein
VWDKDFVGSCSQTSRDIGQVEGKEFDEDQQEDITAEQKLSGPHLSKRKMNLKENFALFQDHNIFVISRKWNNERKTDTFHGSCRR